MKQTALWWQRLVYHVALGDTDLLTDFFKSYYVAPAEWTNVYCRQIDKSRSNITGYVNFQFVWGNIPQYGTEVGYHIRLNTHTCACHVARYWSVLVS